MRRCFGPFALRLIALKFSGFFSASQPVKLCAMTSAEAPASKPSNRLPGIEALRGIAAICVVLLHLQAAFGGHPKVFGKGYLAVDFFLMLSGFLMVRTQEKRFGSLKAAIPFMIARYRRLWPMMALGGILGLPMLIYKSDSIGQFLMIAIPNMALLPVFFPRFVYPLNIPAWTIFYELVANSLHALLLHRLKPVMLSVSLIIGLPIVIAIAQAYGTLDLGARPNTFLAAFPRILFAYLIGMAMGRCWQMRDDSRPYLAALALPAMPAIFVASWYFGITHWLFDLAFVMVFCPLIILGGLQMRAPSRIAYWMGGLSFPLFAIHMPILQAGAWFGLSYPVGGLLALSGGVLAKFGSDWLNRKRTIGRTQA